MENKAIPTVYNDVLFRSKNEAKWAMFFDKLNIKYSYEPTFFRVEDIQYRPDFYFPEYDKFAEVKSSVSGIQNNNMAWKLNYLIDYQATELSKGLLLLGSFPYDVRTLFARLKTKWLFWHEGVCCANAYIQQKIENPSIEGEMLFTKECIDSGSPLPTSASPDIFVEPFKPGAYLSLFIDDVNDWFSPKNSIFDEINKMKANEIKEVPF